MAQVGTSKATATSLCYSASLQRPLRLSSKPGSGLTSPSTSRSCRPLLSLGEEPRELRRVREEEVREGRPPFTQVLVPSSPVLQVASGERSLST